MSKFNVNKIKKEAYRIINFLGAINSLNSAISFI